MIASDVHEAENVYASVCHHRPSCVLADAGEQGISLPESSCDCGALWARFSREIYATHNIVTETAGNDFYGQIAQSGVDTIGTIGTPITPTNNFSEMVLSTGSTAAAASNTSISMTSPVTIRKTIDTAYPLSNDGDANNPGTTTARSLTWRTSFTTGEALATLTEICIGTTTTVYNGIATDPLLMRALFAGPFTKTSSDTLTVYVNHTFIGQ